MDWRKKYLYSLKPQAIPTTLLKRTQSQVFFCEFGKIFQNSFPIERM